MMAPIHKRRWHPPTHSIQPNQSWSFADCRLMGRAIVPRKKAMAMMIRFYCWLRSGCCSVACRANQVRLEYTIHLSNPITSKGKEIWEQDQEQYNGSGAPTFMGATAVSSSLLACIGSLFHYPEFTIDLCSSSHHFSIYEAVT